MKMNRRSPLLFVVLFSAFAVVGISLSSHFVQAQKPVSPAGPMVHMVALGTDHATPTALAIKKGDYVQFNSKDGGLHEIALGSGDAYASNHNHEGIDQAGSGIFKADEGYKVQFKKTGTYEFHDHLHPDVFVSVIVYQASK